MTAEDYIARAKALSQQTDVTPGWGREKAFCDALIGEMRAASLLAVCVPERFGGPGLGVEAIAQITHAIARQSGSAGLVYAMHMSQACSIAAHAKTEAFDALQERMVRDQLLIASGASEKGPGGDILTSICEVVPDGDGGFVVDKESPNISYIDHADLVLVTANRVSDRGRKRQVLVAAEVDRDRFEPGRDATFFGMQGILNRPYKFRVAFGEDAIFPGDFAAIARQTMTPTIQIFWAALWSGIAWAVIDKAKRYVGKEVPEGEISGVMHYEMTRLVDRHHMMNAMIHDAIRAYEARGEARDMGFGLSAQINRVKINCSELLLQICVAALEIMGIRAYATGGPYSLAEPVADAMSAPVMVSNYRLAMNTAKIERFVDEAL